MSVVIVGNKGYGKYGRETVGPMGMGNTGSDGALEL